MVPEIVQQRFRVRQRQAFHVGVAAPAQIENVAARPGMTADCRMECAGAGYRVIVAFHSLAQVAAGIVGAVVFDSPSFDAPAQRRRHVSEGGFHAGEPGVAAGGRNLDGIEQGGAGRLIEIGHVGVPGGLNGAEAAELAAVVVLDVGDHVELRISVDHRPALLVDGRRIKLTEKAAEADEVFRSQVLAAKKNAAVRVECQFDPFRVPRGHGLEIQAGDFEAQCRVHGTAGKTGGPNRTFMGFIRAHYAHVFFPKPWSSVKGATNGVRAGR